MGKTIYHSALRQMGPVTVTIRSDVLKSKFQGKPDYVLLDIAGEERIYNVENADCAEFFRGHKGRTFAILAEGTKEDATIGYVGEAASEPEPQEQPPARNTAKAPAQAPRGKGAPPPAKGPPARQNAPPPAQTRPAAPPAQQAARQAQVAPQESPEQKLGRSRAYAARLAVAHGVAYAAARYARTQVRERFQEEISDIDFSGIVMNFLIQLERDGFVNGLPVRVEEPAAAPAQQQEPSDNDGNV